MENGSDSLCLIVGQVKMTGGDVHSDFTCKKLNILAKKFEFSFIY
jgi:hypothetical protein